MTATTPSSNPFTGIIIRESADDGSDFANPSADYRRLYLGEDGALHLKDSAGTVTDIGGGGGDITTDAAWAAKGDLIAATANNAAAVVSVGTNGSSVRAASGAASGIEWQKNNLAASVAPAVTDDIDLGYTVGSRWIDTTHDKEYVCLDNTDGAAVWTETTQAGGGGGLASARARTAAGNYSLNNTSWTNVDTGLDLVVAAAAGDVLLVQLSALAAGSTPPLSFDAVTIVSGSPVNSISGSGGAGQQGLQAWYAASGTEISISGGCQYVVQAGDISGGNVTLRLRFVSGYSAARTVYATAVNPLHWSVVNLGQ